MLAAQRSAQEVRARLMNPINAVHDLGIDLKRKIIPINIETIVSLEVFGPKLPSANDLAFGPVVHPQPILRSMKIEDIQRAVAIKYKVSRLDLMSVRRFNRIVRPRQIAMYLARTLTTRSFPEIGRRFGGRDHTTVLYAVRKIEHLREEDENVNMEILDLIETITEAKYSYR